MGRDIAAPTTRLSKQVNAQYTIELALCTQTLLAIDRNVQATLKSKRLRMVFHIDEIFPDATTVLCQLRPCVADIRRAKKSTVLGEIAVSVILVALPPVIRRYSVVQIGFIILDKVKKIMIPIAVVVVERVFALFSSRYSFD